MLDLDVIEKKSKVVVRLKFLQHNNAISISFELVVKIYIRP